MIGIIGTFCGLAALWALRTLRMRTRERDDMQAMRDKAYADAAEAYRVAGLGNHWDRKRRV